MKGAWVLNRKRGLLAWGWEWGVEGWGVGSGGERQTEEGRLGTRGDLG